jgi:hypothetical protein
MAADIQPSRSTLWYRHNVFFFILIYLFGFYTVILIICMIADPVHAAITASAGAQQKNGDNNDE